MAASAIATQVVFRDFRGTEMKMYRVAIVPVEWRHGKGLTKAGGREGRDRVGGNCSEGMSFGALGKNEGRKRNSHPNEPYVSDISPRKYGLPG